MDEVCYYKRLYPLWENIPSEGDKIRVDCDIKVHFSWNNYGPSSYLLLIAREQEREPLFLSQETL